MQKRKCRKENAEKKKMRKRYHCLDKEEVFFEKGAGFFLSKDFQYFFFELFEGSHSNLKNKNTLHILKFHLFFPLGWPHHSVFPSMVRLLKKKILLFGPFFSEKKSRLEKLVVSFVKLFHL